MSRWVTKVRSSLWFVPVLCVLAGGVISFATIAVDRATAFELIPRSYTGDADSALAILETVAASMVSLTALVLTVTMVVVQLAMGQFSPRIVQSFLRDKPSQITIGVFVATFAHAMLALREVNVTEDQVPGLAVVVAYGLIVVSIVLLVVYVHHIGESLRVSALIEMVSHQSRKTIDRGFPPMARTADSRRSDARGVVLTRRSGVVSKIEEKRLVRLARDAGCTLELVPKPGDFVPSGAPLFHVVGDPSRLDHRKVGRAVALTLDRAIPDDLAYGFRLLVDIAERSLAESPFLDPTTAVQSIDRLHDTLRQLVTREFPTGEHRDETGRVRLVTAAMGWDDFVHLAFDEIRIAGSGSPQVARRIEAALDDLLTIAPDDRRGALEEEHRLLVAAIRRTYQDGRDIELALVADGQGMS